ncbi:MAG TPA: hypothetical protein V6C91_21630 [Coleofasciculaceae cyanobacterium]
MKTSELKFLFKLLGFEEYRAPLSKIKLASVAASKREQICRNLCDRGFLACSYKIDKFQIAPPGQFLLEQDLKHLPLTENELKVLQASAKGTIKPKETNIPAKERKTTIQNLAERGLIQVASKNKKIKEVWLTERGQEYLQYEYNPNGTSAVLSQELLTNYLQFLRKSFQDVFSPAEIATQTIQEEKILLTIRELEQKLTVDNPLPTYNNPFTELQQSLISPPQLYRFATYSP